MATAHNITISADMLCAKSLSNAAVLVVGGETFTGKVLVAQLLLNVQLKALYILVDTDSDSAKTWLHDKAFDCVRRSKPTSLDDVVVVESHSIDIDLDAISLSNSSADLLGVNTDIAGRLHRTNISVVYSCISCGGKEDEDLDVSLSCAVKRYVGRPLAIQRACRLLMGTAPPLLIHLSTIAIVSSCYERTHADIKEELIALPHDVSVDQVIASIEQADSPSQVHLPIWNALGPHDDTNRPTDDDSYKNNLLNYLGFPNTWALACCLAEHVLSHKSRNYVPTIVVRAGLLAPALSIPETGWIDRVTPFTAVLLGRGEAMHILDSGNGHSNVVAIDHLANVLIAVAEARVAAQRSMYIVHCPSHRYDVVNWSFISRVAMAYWSGCNKCSLEHFPVACFETHCEENDVKLSLTKRIEAIRKHVSFGFYSGVGVDNSIVSGMGRGVARLGRSLSSSRFHFIDMEAKRWSPHARGLKKASVLHHRRQSPLLIAPAYSTNPTLADEYEMDWGQYITLACYGVHRFLFHAFVRRPASTLSSTSVCLIHHPPPPPSLSSIDASQARYAHTTSTYFPSLAFARHRESYPLPVYRNMRSRTPIDIQDAVLASDRVRTAITRVMNKSGISEAEVCSQARSMVEEMGHRFHYLAIRALAFVLRSAFHQLYSGVVVDDAQIAHLRALSRHSPIVLLPSHRSYFDFLLMSYVMYSFNLPVPAIAAGKDFMSMAGVGWLLRKAGAFFIRRSFGSDVLYWAIFTEYVQTHLCNGDAPIEFFIEGTRSRSGKSLHPKKGMLSLILEPFFRLDIADCTFVPVSLSYERILEGGLYARELLGIPKPKESTRRLVQARSVLNEDFGRIRISFASPISLANYCSHHGYNRANVIASNSTDVTHRITHALSYDIVRAHQKCFVACATHICAGLLLWKPSQTISVNNLEELAPLLQLWLLRRGVSSDWVQGEDTLTVVLGGLRLLKNFIQLESPHGSKDIRNCNVLFEGIENTVALSLYRNHLLNAFSDDAIALVALYMTLECMISVDTSCSVVHISAVESKAWFCTIASLLWAEIVPAAGTLSQRYMQALQRLAVETSLDENKGIDMCVDGIIISIHGNYASWLCRLLAPLIDSAWMCALEASGKTNEDSDEKPRSLQKAALALCRSGALPYSEAVSSDSLKNAGVALKSLVKLGGQQVKVSILANLRLIHRVLHRKLNNVLPNDFVARFNDDELNNIGWLAYLVAADESQTAVRAKVPIINPNDTPIRAKL